MILEGELMSNIAVLLQRRALITCPSHFRPEKNDCLQEATSQNVVL